MKNWLFNLLYPSAVADFNRAADEYKAAHARELKEYHDGQQKQIAEINDSHNRALRSLERRWDKHRNVAWPRPATRIPAHVVLKEFNVPLDTGLMAAMHQELDDAIQELLDVVSQPPSATLTGEQRLHLAGGIEHLRLFQKNLLDRAAAASTADKELEGDEKEGA